MKNIKSVIRSDAKRKDNQRSIYIRYTYNRRFLLFNTGTYVSVANWNEVAGRVRKSFNSELKNSILIQAERDMETIVLELISQKKEPTLLNVKIEYYKAQNQTLSKANKPIKQDEKLFLKDFKEFIDYQTDNKKVAEQTYKTYNTTYNKLAKFQADTPYVLHYNTINSVFYDKFLKFLRDQGLAENSVDKHIKNTKLFMNYTLSKEKHTNNVFHTFKRTRTKADFVVLDSDELRKLYYEYKPSGRDAKRNEQMRDAFVLGCTTGLRFGDLTKLTRGNFHIARDKGTKEIIPTAADSYIDVRTQKTDESVRIPFNHLICELVNKYNIENKEPTFLKYNSQLFNREIKTICREAGIKRIVKVSTKRNQEAKFEQGEKCDFVSSHTMRRTFITLLSTRTEIANIQAVSGHKDIKVLTDYIKRSDKELNAVRCCFDEVFYRDTKDNDLLTTPKAKVRIAVKSAPQDKVLVTIRGTRKTSAE